MCRVTRNYAILNDRQVDGAMKRAGIGSHVSQTVRRMCVPPSAMISAGARP